MYRLSRVGNAEAQNQKVRLLHRSLLKLHLNPFLRYLLRPEVSFLAQSLWHCLFFLLRRTTDCSYAHYRCMIGSNDSEDVLHSRYIDTVVFYAR